MEEVKTREKKRREVNSEKHKARARAYYEKNKEAVTLRIKKYRKKNPDKLRQFKKNYYWTHREKRLAEVKAYRQTAAGRAAAARRSSKRRASEKRATPAWSNRVREIVMYELRDSLTEDCRGEPFHVDHDIPLQGKRVSGLHVHNNLEVLQGTVNRDKRHKFDIEDFPLGIPGPIWLADRNAVYSDIARRAREAYRTKNVVRRVRSAKD